MDDRTDAMEARALEILQVLESIDGALSEQFTSVDGVAFKVSLIHGLIANAQQKRTGILASINLAVWISAIAIVAGVVHHW